MSFEVKILGSSSATPVYNRHQSAQVVQLENELFLIDCGEGTQMQISRYHIKLNKINYIFISHLHGDHYLGLVGLVSTMHLFGRSKELYIFGPKGLAEIITLQLKYSESVLNYKIIFHELDTEKNYVLLDLPKVTIETIPLIHRINCCGFLFSEKPTNRRIIKEMLPENTSLLDIASLKKGKDVYDEEGEIVLSCKENTYPQKLPRKYAYMSDTAYSEAYIHKIQGVDLLYHEATFLDDLKERAKVTHHTTALGAATFAKKAGVDKLLLGHFSSRYKELEPLLEEAKTVFPNSALALEGLCFSIENKIEEEL